MKPEDMYVSVTDKKGYKYYIFAQSQTVTVVATFGNRGIKVEGSTIKETLQKAFEGMKAHLY
ncbi:hypothetical protein H9655_08765 [Cytobacillus sp. Sa5YUA1]|uniref:DUF1508 domain-containing protein n=1 Tax=Cytobacillus stercorigallinarum TaxID=2762240 RepID=A0ABR8QNX3_9BACI|nr:hypothetical protein [Cytobacillus stercorigallinarum]MBD7937122.1 hypothetical protein [Cytobacillus stercorigallinarum]